MEDTTKFNIKGALDRCLGFAKQTVMRISGCKGFMKRLPIASVLIAAAIAAGIILARSVNTFEIIEGGKTFTVYSISKDAVSAVEKIGLVPGEYEILNTKNCGNTKQISIEKTFPVTIIAGDEQITVKTVTSRVGAILKRAGIVVDEYDMIEPAANTVISGESIIDYVNVDYVDEQDEEIIPCTYKTVFTTTMQSGSSVTFEGTDGLKTVSYKTKLVNGIVAEKTVVGEQVLTAAVNGTKLVGTGSGGRITTGVAVTSSSNTGCYSTLTPATPIPLDENGVPTNYVNHVTVQATAYTYTGFRTSTGKNPQPGYIAVNPNYIPYGTKMYIVSSDGNWVYGYAEAADTGGFVSSRPTNVDLFLETVSQCWAFGRRNVEIYFLP